MQQKLKEPKKNPVSIGNIWFEIQNSAIICLIQLLKLQSIYGWHLKSKLAKQLMFNLAD